MNVSTMRRMAALVAVAGGGAIAGCNPVAVGVGAMTPAQIESVLAAISWTGCATVVRAARPAGTTTSVEICAAPNAREFGPRNAPPGLGAPVARMRNGSNVEARWGLQPNNTYSIWLHSGGVTGGTMYTIIGNGVNITGTYHGCGHGAAGTSEANFGTCADNPYPLVGPRNRGPSSAGEDDKREHTLLDRATGPAWISCTEGCCTTGAT